MHLCKVSWYGSSVLYNKENENWKKEKRETRKIGFKTRKNSISEEE
jgi:hypothetical protein